MEEDSFSSGFSTDSEYSTDGKCDYMSIINEINKQSPKSIEVIDNGFYINDQNSVINFIGTLMEETNFLDSKASKYKNVASIKDKEILRLKNINDKLEDSLEKAEKKMFVVETKYDSLKKESLEQQNSKVFEGENSLLKGDVCLLKGDICLLKGEISLLKDENVSLKSNNILLQGENDLLQGENILLQKEIDSKIDLAEEHASLVKKIGELSDTNNEVLEHEDVFELGKIFEYEKVLNTVVDKLLKLEVDYENLLKKSSNSDYDELPENDITIEDLKIQLSSQLVTIDKLESIIQNFKMYDVENSQLVKNNTELILAFNLLVEKYTSLKKVSQFYENQLLSYDNYLKNITKQYSTKMEKLTNALSYQENINENLKSTVRQPKFRYSFRENTFRQ